MEGMAHPASSRTSSLNHTTSHTASSSSSPASGTGVPSNPTDRSP